MEIQSEYPDIWELKIREMKMIDRSKESIATFTLQSEDRIWYAMENIEGDKCIYKLLLNEEICIIDPYAQGYVVLDGVMWSVRAKNQTDLKKEIQQLEGFDIVVSGQMNHAVTAARKQKIFYVQYEKRVNVGVEFYSVQGTHELVVVWEDPSQHIYHIDYKMVEPEREEERYGILLWFKLELDEIDRQQQKGTWTVKLLLDGRLVGFEAFSILENGLDDL